MSEEDLKSKIEEYFKKESESLYEPLKIKVSIVDTTCTISLSKMYDGVAKFAKFKHLEWLSELLGTDEINLENALYVSGCDSCDYGSEDSIDIVCYSIKVKENEETQQE